MKTKKQIIYIYQDLIIGIVFTIFSLKINREIKAEIIDLNN